MTVRRRIEAVAAVACALVVCPELGGVGSGGARADSSSVAGMANAGYWQVHTDGHVYAFGNAPDLG